MTTAVARAGTLLRTLRHLKPIQILGRARLLLPVPRPDMGPAPPLRAAGGPWIEPPAREPSLIGPTRLRLLDEEHDLETIGWDDPDLPLLWRYHLHYFDDLNAAQARERRDWPRALIGRWIRENPPAHGTGWAPYPTSRRIVNWIKAFMQGLPYEPHWLRSLAVQARWLERRIEWHLLGNHLFANAKALVFAGLFFDGPEAGRWLSKGVRILRRELAEQILPDGGHFELSPMYHALVFEDVLDLINLLRARQASDTMALAVESALRECAQRMLHWLRCLSHPDGAIAYFNDAAEGMAPSKEALEAYAARLDVQAEQPPVNAVIRLGSSGYVRVARGALLALLDAAPVGASYLPGHAHADTLSFELSLGGRRVIVNGGTSCYGTGAQRQRERGTAWHSTVEVAGENSSEVWHGFRLGRRAHVVDVRIADWTIEGAHDGYCHLAGAPFHRRRWSFEPERMIVEDAVVPARHPAVARYHFAPGVRLVPQASATSWALWDGAQPLAWIRVEAGTAAAARSEYTPCFGRRVPIDTLEVALVSGRARVLWHWGADAHLVSD